MDYHGGTHDPDPQPTLATNDAVIKAGRQTVRELVAAFIAQRPYQQWWQHVAPLLSQRIRADYQHVDPANVPGTAITGDVQLDLHPSGRVATAVVPTDAGDYTIVISRTDTHARWVAERITPPAQRAP